MPKETQFLFKNCKNS